MNIAISLEQQEILAQIEAAKQKLQALREQLTLVDAELEEKSEQIAIYGLLTDLGDKLEQLHGYGADELFWGDKFTSAEEAVAHYESLRKETDVFNREIAVVHEKKDALLKQISDEQYNVEYYEEELEIQKEREERSKNEFVIERELEPLPYRPMVMPWNKKDEDEKRFKKYALIALLLSLLLTFVIPMWDIPKPDRSKPVEVPERLAKLVKKQKPKPKPKPKPKQEQKKPDSKKKPTKKEVKEARKKAANTGLLAFKNNLADLMEDVNDTKLGAQAQLSNKGATAKKTTRSLVTAQATSGSGGIATSSLSRSTGGTGKQIGAVAFSRVTSEIGTAAADDRPLSDGPGPSRTDEEIQIVFDRYKAALYRIYNRELRANPTLQGKMVLRITIQPDGSVSNCKVESTDLASNTLSQKIVARVKQFNFGPKKGVPKVTILYPIDFLPAS